MASRRIPLICLIIVLQFFLLPLGILADDASEVVSMDQLLPIFYALTWLLPLGVALVAVGITETSRAYHVAISLPLALVAALFGYYLCGYAFQFGGVGLVSPDPGLARLLAEWSPLDPRGSPGWGVIGLRGFMFSLDVVSEQELLLFVSQLALVTTAALIPLTTLSGRIPRTLDFILALLVSCVSYPLVGNWVRGGGWFSQLGTTLGLGHGFVDYGVGYVYLVGGGAAIASLLAFKRRGLSTPPSSAPELPPAYLPLNVLIGAFLALIGWLVAILAQPLVPTIQSPAALIYKALCAVAGSIATTCFYGWLVRGKPDPALAGRGILASLVAISAGLPFVPPWAAVLIGAIAGLFLAPAMYVVERVLWLDDRGAAVSIYGLSAIWGFLAVGLFAGGKHGAGWNSFARGSSASSLAQGVTGLFCAQGREYTAHGLALGTGQLYAQLLGTAAILLLSILLPLIVLSLLAYAYALPATIRSRAREHAATLQRERQIREKRQRQGLILNLWQRVRIAYLHYAASAKRRLSHRVHLARQKRGERQASAEHKDSDG